MAEGNGFDAGSMYGLLVEIGKTVSRHDAMFERVFTLLERQDARLTALEQRVERGFADMATKVELTELRQTVEAYHASVVGHGIAISELDSRTHRIEDHLALPPFVHG